MTKTTTTTTPTTNDTPKSETQDLAALTVKTRHDVGERDEDIAALTEERERLQQLLQSKVDAENTLLNGIRAATTSARNSSSNGNGHGGNSQGNVGSASASGSSGGGGRSAGRPHASPNVHISRTGSVFIQ